MRVVPPGVPMAPDGLEAWASATVPFAATTVAGMPAELVDYLELGAHVAEWLPSSWYVHLAVEPDWDGCEGRWLNVEQTSGEPWRGSLCAVGVLDGSADEALAERAKPLLAIGGWELVSEEGGDGLWGYWETALSADPLAAAEGALAPALALFGVREPARWFVAMNVARGYGDDDGPPPPSCTEPTTVDLRAWRASVGLVPPPPTIAPHGTEPWAILCGAGLHHLHAVPCWKRNPDG